MTIQAFVKDHVPPTIDFRFPLHLSHLSARVLGTADTPSVLALRQLVFSTLPSSFRLSPPDPDASIELEREMAWASKHLTTPAVSIGVFDESNLVAYATVVMPNAGYRCEIGERLALSPKNMARSAHMASCFIDPEFRGHGLQRLLLDWRLILAKAATRTLVVAMTAAGNVYSRSNLLATGLSIQQVTERAPGRFWFFLARELGVERTMTGSPVWVRDSDFTRQKQLIFAGFEGVGETEGDAYPTGESYICFSRTLLIPVIAE